MKTLTNLKWVFFGTSRLSTIVLDVLLSKGLKPSLVITTPDKPKGRKLVLTPPETKLWADSNNVPVLQLATLRKDSVLSEIKNVVGEDVDLAVVASYGKIIPKSILDWPKNGTVNVHPSLLPRLRGASPIESAILSECETGVTIIELDEEVDHGPILAQEKTVTLAPENLPDALDLEKTLAEKGAEMLVNVLEKIVEGTMSKQEQNHSDATFCQKLDKKDAQIDLSGDPFFNIKKIKAYQNLNPYFFDEKNNNKRVVIKRANLLNGILVLEKVVPENGKEMLYKDYLNGIH